jgi:uncharacterized membrane protein
MENKNVGWILIGLSVLFVIIILLFNVALKDIVNASCSLEHEADSCPMYDTISKQTLLSLGIVGLLIIVGLVLIFSKPEEKIIVKTKTVKEKRKKIDVEGLDKDEKKVVELLQKENGGMFQADLMEKLEMGKVKLTRLLDKLEAKQLIERKRRGMNNIVVLRG